MLNGERKEDGMEHIFRAMQSFQFIMKLLASTCFQLIQVYFKTKNKKLIKVV